MGTGHGHGHGAGGAGGDRRRLVAALLVTLACAVLGAAGALLTGSLALLADLGHLLTDAGALAAAAVASVLAAKPACHHRTFGLGRVEVLVAGLNAVALIAVVVWVAVEGVSRLFAPAEIPGLPLLVIGAAGLLGNVVSLAILAGGDRGNMNLRGAMLHVLGDALGSVGVMVAAVVLVTTGWPYADTLASLLIAALILPRALGLLREVWHVLLEGTPPGIDVAEVRSTLLAVPGVADVHDLHVWAINDRTPSLSAHLVVTGKAEDATGCGATVLDRAGSALRDHFGLSHSTLQLERHAHVGHEHTCH
ncbi:cation diffusion facilitator family transporter [Pseudonocardia kujensis]|uniref:cation diffusion facilitator family transporter n=1 Tax=Pseudonocardia kujensis TaxID=1128675 RepID=UPI001E2B1651|nr:cation diffusion facilitator family transporter [Pseudonocardia kujensis]MCE0765925.1 cation diffusion facilitator family transporter [Pseudonocardia kujensis]